jgi:uncharacterized protein YxjI
MRFYIRQKVFTLKDKFDVFDDTQTTKYQVKGKFMSLKNKLELLDASGNPVLRSERKVLALMPKYFIYDLNGGEVATIKRIFGFRPKFDLTIMDKVYEVDGSFFGHSFTISHMGDVKATISKKIISWGDTYEIEVLEEESVELFLFVVIVLDQVIHERKRR